MIVNGHQKRQQILSFYTRMSPTSEHVKHPTHQPKILMVNDGLLQETQEVEHLDNIFEGKYLRCVDSLQSYMKVSDGCIVHDGFTVVQHFGNDLDLGS